MTRPLPPDDFDDLPTGPIDIDAVLAESAAADERQWSGWRSRGSAGEQEALPAGMSRAAISRRQFRLFLQFAVRSLRVRVIVATLILSAVVIAVLGVVLLGQITSRLLENKRDAAISEIISLRPRVSDALSGADANPSILLAKMKLTLADLSSVNSGASGSQGSTAGVYESVLISTRGLLNRVDAGEYAADIPAALRERISQGILASQYTSVVRGGAAVPALVVGIPVAARGDTSFELYLIYPLTAESSSVAVVQNLMLVGGGVLALLLSGIAALIAHQVVRPVQRASAAAGRLAAGALDERMPVEGAIEISQLAKSFNGMAEAIKAQIRQLEEFGGLQRRFTSDVSHELRTPLTTVRMAADLLYDAREDLPPYLLRSTELMVDELDRFEDLLADLLEISRYDAGMAELNAKPIDMRSTITNCVAAVKTIADTAGVEVITELPEVAIRAEIDSRRIERILRNLLANAVDHAEGRPVRVQLAADADAVAVSVTDEGVGLNPGEAGLVFNRFWRADPSRQRQTGGTGLGLAIAMEDAKLHGGWLQAYGHPGLGSRFRLTLPRQSGTLLTESPLPLEPEEHGITSTDESHTRYSTDVQSYHYPFDSGFTMSGVNMSGTALSGITMSIPAAGREPEQPASAVSDRSVPAVARDAAIADAADADAATVESAGADSAGAESAGANSATAESAQVEAIGADVSGPSEGSR